MGLEGKTVLVTRARGQNTELRGLLERSGARVIEIPTIEIREPNDWEPAEQAIRALDGYDWIVFTSANALDAFCNRAGSDSLPRVAVVGGQTARRARSRGIHVDLVPDRYRAEALLDCFPGRMPDTRILMPRGDIAGEELPAGLRSRGAIVDTVDVYRTLIPEGSRAPLQRCIEADRPDCITFTSGSTVRNFLEMLEGGMREHALEGIVIAVIGPVTRRIAESRGLRVAVEPDTASAPALAEAILRYFSN